MIATRIKELRLELKLTQKQLAEKISCTSKSIWAYENRIAVPPVDVMIRMANFFECSLDYLVGRSNDAGSVIISAQQLDLTTQEQEMVRNFRNMTDKQKFSVLSVISTISDVSKK